MYYNEIPRWPELWLIHKIVMSAAKMRILINDSLKCLRMFVQFNPGSDLILRLDIYEDNSKVQCSDYKECTEITRSVHANLAASHSKCMTCYWSFEDAWFSSWSFLVNLLKFHNFINEDLSFDYFPLFVSWIWALFLKIWNCLLNIIYPL